MGKFDGKKLLELGTSVGSVDIIRYAKKEGAYVFVADYLSKEQSPAKKIANKSLLISTLDLPALISCVINNKIDSIFSGVSEANLVSAQYVSKHTGKSFYFSEKQWADFMTKDSFHNLCEKYGVPTPRVYFSGPVDNFSLRSVEYPVIVKPVDGCANIGISIVSEEKDLKKAISKASANSKSKNIIIEQFIDGIEISSTYVIKDGICKLVCFGSKYPYQNKSNLKALSSAYIYPSAYISEYETTLDEKICSMILGEHLDNCVIFFQGIYAEKKFFIFEAGLRMEGTASYNITKLFSGQNFMEFMVDRSFGVESDYNINLEDPHFKGRKCVKYSQICKGGTIQYIKGYEEIIKDPLIFSSEQRHFPGDKILEDGSLRQIMFRYNIVSDNIDDIIKLIKRIQKTVVAIDAKGNNLLSDNFNPSILKEEFNRS